MKKIITVIIFVLIFFLILFLLFSGPTTNGSTIAYEHMIDIEPVTRQIKWKREPGCMYEMPKNMITVLDKYGIKEADKDDDDYVLYFPCTYNETQKEINLAIPTKHDQRFFIVNNADEISSKDHIWKNLVKLYGRNNASTVMPKTYVLYNGEDIALFKKEYNPDKIYIMKKNIQRQEGLKITNKYDEIMNGTKNGYVIVQELLQNPYIIDGRKTNMRFYLLLVCKDNEVSAYVFNEGFMYYTKVPFIKGSLQEDPNITTGYIDRKVYETNPLTLGDLKKYLDNRKFSDLNLAEKNIIRNGKSISSVAFDNIYNTIRKVVVAVKHTVCMNSHLKNNLTYQLFGVDVALDDQLGAMIMEVNKGPDLGYKSERDAQVKIKATEDILKVIKVVPNYKNHGYIKLYEDDDDDDDDETDYWNYED